MTHLTRSALAALALAALASCGGAGTSEPPPDDGGPDVIDVSGEFDDPSDFDPIGCVAGSLASLDPTGIWHQDVHLEWGDFPTVMRIDPDAEAWAALLGGREATIDVTDDHVLVRLVYETTAGDTRVRSFLGCALTDGGDITGKVAFCQGGMCYQGTFESVRVERIAGEAESDGTTLVAEWAGDPAAPWPHAESPGDSITVNVRVVDGVAYVARYADGLRIVDVGDPARPVDLGWSPPVLVEQHEIYNDVKIVDGPGGKRYALLASSDRGVVVVDVTDPTAPVERGAFPPVPDGEDHINVHTLFTETRDGTTRAYLANTTTIGLDVYDVTDPETAQALGSFVHPDVEVDPSAYLHDLYVEDGLAYLDYWGLGLVIVDANDPAAIVEVGRYDDYPRRTNHSNWVTTAGGRKIALTGDEDFGAHAHVVDVDPASSTYLARIGELRLRPEVSIHNVMAFGDRGYVAWYQDGLRILDLSDPTQPSVLAYYNTWDGRDGVSFYEGAIGLDVDLTTNLVYLADTARGLLIVSVDR